jgi:glycosyltransferase involved in cell wall biosynthesis
LVFTRPVIACVHDPFELYDEVRDWKTRRADPQVIGLCKKADFVICISQELQQRLASEGIPSTRVPTASLLPAAPRESIGRSASRPLTAITVGRIYRRKRFELFHEIAAEGKRRGLPIAFRAKFDRSPLPEAEYISYLDRADFYIVTSFQEGGPLPAMDAMQRGLIVLSTTVGQMPEIIVNGVSGFLCNDLAEFVDRLSLLSADRNLVVQMRRESMDRIRRVRNERILHEALMPVLNAAAKLQAVRRQQRFAMPAEVARIPEQPL